MKKSILATLQTLCFMMASHPSPLMADSQAKKHHAYIFATGPDLGLDKTSRQVIAHTQKLANALKDRDTQSDIFSFDQLDLYEIKNIFKKLVEKYGKNLSTTFIVNAHGYNVNGQYKFLGQANGKKVTYSEERLHEMTGNTPSTIALLTCHAGLFSPKNPNIDVFGASTAENILDELQFNAWIDEVINNPYSLKSLDDFNKSWKKGLHHVHKSHRLPFINIHRNQFTMFKT